MSIHNVRPTLFTLAPSYSDRKRARTTQCSNRRPALPVGLTSCLARLLTSCRCLVCSGPEGGGPEEKAAAVHRPLQVPAQLPQPLVCPLGVHPFGPHQPGNPGNPSLLG